MTSSGTASSPWAASHASDFEAGVDGHDAPCQRLPSNAAEALGADHLSKVLRGRELPDALHQVAVRVAVPRDGLPHAGDDLERVGVVELPEEGQGDVAELEAVEAAPGAQHAVGLAEGAVAARDVADPEGHRVGVEAAVGEGEFGVAMHPLQGAPRPHAPLRAPLPLCEHLLVDVQHGHLRGLPGGGERGGCTQDSPKGDVPCAPRDVQVLHAPEWPQLVDEVVLPDAMEPRRHQVVHDIIPLCHAGEDTTHQPVLLPLGDVPEPEVDPGVLALALALSGALALGPGAIGGFSYRVSCEAACRARRPHRKQLGATAEPVVRRTQAAPDDAQHELLFARNPTRRGGPAGQLLRVWREAAQARLNLSRHRPDVALQGLADGNAY